MTTSSRGVTTSEAASALNVERRTIVRLVDRGVLSPTAKLPGRTGAYLFDPDDIDRLAADRAATT